jgi:hypothetical protein
MTTPLKILVHDAGTGTCSLTGKEQDGLTVTFEDGTVTSQFLSWKAFRQLLAMKTAGNGKAPGPSKPAPAALVVPSPAPTSGSSAPK